MMNQMKNIKAIIFEIDGVLIDVTNSYMLAIKKTAEFFLGKMLSMKDVEAVKNRGISNDCDAAEIIIQEGGGDFRKKVIIKKFHEHYWGRQIDGLVDNEKCLIKGDVLKKLKGYKLGIVTGRPGEESDYGLKRFDMYDYFDSIVMQYDVEEGKPNPEGLLKCIKSLGVNKDEVVYAGSNLADMRAANNAGVSFIGVVSTGLDKDYMKGLFKSEGVEIVLNNVRDIIEVL